MSALHSCTTLWLKLKQSVDYKNIGDFFLILQKKVARDERARREDPLMAIVLPGCVQGGQATSIHDEFMNLHPADE